MWGLSPIGTQGGNSFYKMKFLGILAHLSMSALLDNTVGTLKTNMIRSPRIYSCYRNFQRWSREPWIF